MELIERDRALADLNTWLLDARARQGRMVWLGGEAGGGKSALLRHFIADLPRDVTALTGLCEPLNTPRPLGPVVDIAAELDPSIGQMLQDETPRDQLFRSLSDRLHDGARRVLAFEDVHWADQATLDLLAYLGRRLGDTSTLLVATYRNDEVGSGHPLTAVIGHLATAPAVRRLEVQPLSRSGVGTLADGSNLDPDDLYTRTGGNPFFVSEILAVRQDGIPDTIRDAVHARTGRLTPAGMRVLETAAVIGFRIEPWLLAEAAHEDADAVAECSRIGMLITRGSMLEFRHELSRETIVATMAAPRELHVHRCVLSILQSSPTMMNADHMARLAHHAEEANDASAVVEYAPAAARHAARMKAHREAAAQYARALRFTPDRDLTARVVLLEARAYECYLTSDVEGAMVARRDALRIRRELGDALGTGENLRWISRLSWFCGRPGDAEEAGREAVAVLEHHAGSLQLGWAYSNMSQLSMLADRTHEAIDWGERALAVARASEDAGLQAHALNNVGAARCGAGDAEGRLVLEAALQIGLDHNLEEHVARAYTNLASSAVRVRQLDRAERYLRDGIAYSVAHDVEAWRLYMLGWQAMHHMIQGRWNSATEVAHEVLAHPNVPAVSRIQPLVVLATVRSRRGDPEAATPLEEATELAERTREPQRLAPVAAATAEAIWLGRVDARSTEFVARAYADVRDTANPWLAGELAVWLARLGRTVPVPAGTPMPFLSELAGDMQQAATAWREKGCTYDAARVLVASDDEGHLREALGELERLGAAAVADLTRRRMYALGFRGVPSGPRPSTAAHPAQLTKRQHQVLQLMGEGLTNREIAERLRCGTKTVDHHVSAVLMKLEVENRTEAVRKALDMGLFAQYE